MVGLAICDREVGKPVLVEIRDGQVRRILAGATGPRHLEAPVTPTPLLPNAPLMPADASPGAWSRRQTPPSLPK